MKISWNWLSDWVDLDGLDPDEVAERLTLTGLECEGVERIGHGHDAIVVGHITAIDEHPKADRLVVCTVEVGKDEPYQIVCGAKNMKAGDKVPAALPGSQPPSFDFEIGARKMRGVESRGMLCAGEELGLDDGVDGLLILDPNLEVGTPVFEALGLIDTVIEIGVTPNRPDCLGHYGVAREIAALYDRDLRARPDASEAPLWETTASDLVASELCELVIEDARGCPRYAFAVMEGVEVGPSPAWLAAKLTSIGVRSINNVVDVTNYVLFDIGQPLHAFDLDKLGSKIVVRRATDGEEMTGINHKEYTLTSKDLVIADATRPVAIAGVMGGEGTEVTEATTRILIECAYFDPTTVRKSSKRHDLHTDSSHRFERGIDPGATEKNLQRAVSVMADVVSDGAVVAKGRGLVQESDAEPVTIALPVGLSTRVLGLQVDEPQVRATLESIGAQITGEEGDDLIVVAPTWRPDLTRPIDLVEEVGRLVGFDKIEDRLPAGLMGGEHVKRAGSDLETTLLSAADRDALRAVRRTLLDQGLHEAVNYSFFGEGDLAALDIPADHAWRAARAVANPLTVKHGLMRTSLLPGLLTNLKTNLSQRRADVALFEVGRRYLENEREPKTLGILLTGGRADHWSRSGGAWDFYDLKGLVEVIAASRALDGATWRVPTSPEPYLHPGVQAEWVVGEQRIAIIGRLHPRHEQAQDLPATLLAEVDLQALLDTPERVLAYEKVSSYPPVTRDFAFVQDASAPYEELRQQILKYGALGDESGALMQSVSVFDVYEGEHVEEGKRSVAVQVVFQAEDRTLTDEEVGHVSERLIAYVQEHANVTLRA